MPGSDYSKQWNEARDGGDTEDFLDDLLEELDEIKQDIIYNFRDKFESDSNLDEN